MRRKQLVFVSLFLLGWFLVASGAVWGQAATSVRGTVTDPSGAAIPNARVHLLEVATNAERTATTDSQGNYAFSQVVPDTYKLTVEAEGFATYERPGVVLRVNLPSTINARMKIGQAHEVVTVTEAEPVLNMTDASEGNTMGQMQIQQLPIEAKDVTQLLSLQPGVIYTSDRTDLNTNTYDTRGGAVNGERSDQNNVTLDGADDNQQNTGAAFQSVLPVPIESVQEFRVTTSNYGADQGRSAGAQVTLVTRSGSNGFHGAAYEFNRSAIGEANDYFIKQSEGNSGQANKPLPLVRNIFGGAVGGPIKKDRLFFFVNYEGRRRAQADSVVRTIPTASLRDGAMMYLCQTQSDGKTPVDSRCNGPSSVKGRSGASYNVPAGYYGLSPSQIAGMDPLGLGPNSASLKYFNTYPLPNDTTVGDGYNFSGYRFPGHVYERDEWLVARIDYKITANGNHTLFWRGSGRNDIVPGVYGPGSLDTSGDPFLPGQPPLSTLLDRSKGFVLGYTAVLRPNLVNNFHYGYTRQSNGFLGISNQPWIYVRLLSQPINYTQDFILPVNNFVDDLTWTKGNHSFSFGTDIRLIRNSTSNFNNSYNYGTTNAAWLDTAGFANTGSPFSPDNSTVCGGTACPAVDSTFTNSYDFPLIGMLGMVSEVDGLYNYNVQKNGSATALAQGAPISRNWADGEYDLYFQDSWKLRSNLTFNYGLRYELMQPVYETNGQQVAPTFGLSQWFDQRGSNMLQGIPSNQSPNISFGLAGPANGKAGYYNWQTKNFAPRVSVAWSPNPNANWLERLVGNAGQSVIRAGFGMYYDHFGEQLVQTFDQNGAFGLSTNLSNPAQTETAASAPRLTGFNTIPTVDNSGAPILLTPPTPIFPETFPQGNTCICWGVDNSIKTPYSYAMDLSYSREISKDTSFEVAYIGHLARHLLVQEDLAQPMDLVDPKTKVDYYSAATALAKLYRNNVPVTDITAAKVGPTASYWGDMIQPVQPGGAYSLSALGCSGGSTTSALAAAYDLFSCYANNEVSALYVLDVNGIPDANNASQTYFPRGGQYSYFDNQYSSLYAWRSIGNSSYNALQVTLKRNISKGLQFDVNYTYSKCIDLESDAERVGFNNGLGGEIVNAWDPNQLRGPCDFDLTHQVNANWVWELPLGRGKAFASGINKGLEAVIGGWQLSGLGRWSSGFPVNVANGYFFPTNYELSGQALLSGAPIPTGRAVVNGDINMFSNPAAAYNGFEHTFPGQSGNRNAIRGDGYKGLDMGLSKTWIMPYNDRHSLEFEWNVFNVTNSVSFDVQTASLSLDTASTFGRYTGLLTNPRVMQFGLTYAF